MSERSGTRSEREEPALIGAEVARQYGISDSGGRRPPSVRDLMSVEPVNYQGKAAP